MRKIVWSAVALVSALMAGVSDREIAHMFVVGFEGTKVPADIRKAICDYELGGVILFSKNIRSKEQLRTLTRTLNGCAHRPLIAVDQEGGKVRRIRFDNRVYPRAAQVARSGAASARRYYRAMADELAGLGINYNLAPVADLAINPNNYIITKLGRSYGSDPAQVIRYNNLFIEAMHSRGILTSLKHFPGHGSSRGDTHKGFVDVSQTWDPKELKPFGNRRADSVMVAHVVNDRIGDPGVPASLSPKAIRTLRQQNPHVVAITDDLQMGAIRKHYSLRETIRRAIGAGDDILLFGNQLSRKDKVTTRKLIGIVKSLIQQDKSLERNIKQANVRLRRMRRHLKPLPARRHPRPTHRATSKQPHKSISIEEVLSKGNNGQNF